MCFLCLYIFQWFNYLTLDSVYDTSVSYIQSPIGKVRVENIKSVSEPRFYKNNNESAAKRSLNFEPVSSKEII